MSKTLLHDIGREFLQTFTCDRKRLIDVGHNYANLANTHVSTNVSYWFIYNGIYYLCQYLLTINMSVSRVFTDN